MRKTGRDLADTWSAVLASEKLQVVSIFKKIPPGLMTRTGGIDQSSKKTLKLTVQEERSLRGQSLLHLHHHHHLDRR